MLISATKFSGQSREATANDAGDVDDADDDDWAADGLAKLGLAAGHDGALLRMRADCASNSLHVQPALAASHGARALGRHAMQQHGDDVCRWVLMRMPMFLAM